MIAHRRHWMQDLGAATLKAGLRNLAILAGLLVLWLPWHNADAALVGPSGYTNAFTTQPSSQDWATASRTGSQNDTYDSDTDVNANISSSSVFAQTTLDAGNPPPKLVTAA
jgi:hypothetical protein